MLYGNSYEGRQRECGNCGHFTNVHAYCPTCDWNMCERCEDYHDCPKAPAPNAHVHPVFARALNVACIGNGLYVRTAARRTR